MEPGYIGQHDEMESMSLMPPFDATMDEFSDLFGDTMDFDMGSPAAPSTVMQCAGAFGSQSPDHGVLGVDSQQQQQQEQPMPFRAKAIPKETWDRLRPIIEDLYSNKGLGLAEVIARMGEEHDFHATEPMYKNRFRTWKTRKNYSKEQKEEVIRQIEQLAQQESTDDADYPLEVNGKPVEERRLWRSVRQKGKRVTLGRRPGPDIRMKIRQRRPGRNGAVPFQRQLLQHSPESQNLESLLKSTHTYYSWYTDQTEIQADYGATPSLRETFLQVNLATHFLHHNTSRGFALLNGFCSGFQIQLKAQPFQLIQSLIRNFFDNELWAGSEQVRQSLLRFLASLGEVSLGPRHPVTSCIRLLAHVEAAQFPHLIQGIAGLLTNTVKTSFGNDYKNSTLLGFSVITMLFECGLSTQAQDACLTFWDPNQSSSSAMTRNQLRGMVWMARIYRHKGDYDSAERLFTQYFDWVKAKPSSRRRRRSATFVYRDMGFICHMTGRFSESEEHYLLAIEGAWEDESVTLAEMMAVLSEFELSLKQQGKHEEAARLRIRYGQVWTELQEMNVD